MYLNQFSYIIQTSIMDVVHFDTTAVSYDRNKQLPIFLIQLRSP